MYLEVISLCSSSLCKSLIWLIKVTGYLLWPNILFYVNLIFCGSYISCKYTCTAKYLFHVRGRVHEQQASSRQTNSTRLIEISAEVARCWLPTCEVTRAVKLCQSQWVWLINYSWMHVYCSCVIVKSMTVNCDWNVKNVDCEKTMKNYTTQALHLAVLFVVLLTWFLKGLMPFKMAR